MRKGLAVSPGVVVGTAHCVQEIFLAPGIETRENLDVKSELARYDQARENAGRDLEATEDKVTRQGGAEQAAIFSAHLSILRDATFTNRIRTWIIADRISGQAALHRVLEEYTEIFARVKDEYLKERLNDVRDVILRISRHLVAPEEPPADELSGPLILVAEELLPSQVVMLGDMQVKGIVTQAGSRTSHAAIVARSLGIPAVSGVKDVLRQVTTGDTLIVDGRAGRVIVNPDAETRAAFLKLEREFFDFKDHLAENRDHPAQTADGVPLELLANINSVVDAEAATAMGASGIGLFRTEYLYLTHPVVPGEEEQFSEYCDVIRSSPRHSVTIRTLDLGGDKTVPFLGHVHRESNPFMGWRSIRLCFEHPEFLHTQLRAIMRAAAVAREMSGEVHLMFPMITTLEEVRRVRSLVRKTRKQLQDSGIHYVDVRLGMMVEVPAAAIALDTMFDLVDFVSIGSNDLIQYLMAADRDNPKVSHLCQPLAPPVLRVLHEVIQKCNRSKKPVTLCGEMAGQPRTFALLLGMGLRSFSMSPAFVPYIKEFAHYLSVDRAQQLLKKALQMDTTARITRYLNSELPKIFPDFDRLDVG